MNPGIDDQTRIFTSDPIVLRIGRAPDNDLILDDPHASNHHATLSQTAQGWVVRDLGSSNGTALNGVLVEAPIVAVPGDTLLIGRTYLRVVPDGVDWITDSPQAGLHGGPARAGHQERVSGPGISWDERLSSTTLLAAPTQQPVPDRATSITDNSFVWALAFTPLLYLLVDMALGSVSGTSAATWGFVIAVTVNSLLVALDYRRLPADTRPSMWLGFFLVPLYLFQRSSRLRQTMAIPVTWVIAFALAVLIPLATGVGMLMDSSAVEQSIESGIQEQLGVAVSAECPDGVSVKPSTSVQCVITAFDGSTAIVDVTFQNSAGDFVWQVR